jgi:hypothetical protein
MWVPLRKLRISRFDPVTNDVELRDPSGNTFYRETVQVIPGRTTEIHPDHAG